MMFPVPEFGEPVSTPPKLSLFSLPTKPSTLQDGPTPPPNTVATIPFLWEEAPGKPRRPTSTDDPPKSKTVRSLDLPPRLTTTVGTATSNVTNSSGGIEIIPSPTTVLGGPYECVYTFNKSMLGSPEKVVGCSNYSGRSKGKITMPLRNLMRKEKSPVKLISSWRWDSFRDIGVDKGDRSPAVKFCSWRWDSFRDMGGGGKSGGSSCRSVGGSGSLSSSFDDFQKSLDSNSKITKVTRKNSFTFLNRSSSGFLAGMYGTFKQAMQRKSRR
ncbi:unnamed protein product [Lactuca saligna]|uniref:Uncharacterized protein n=1 Tax=Lactuca saligna TaxID=75948 RepID=A0AA36ENC1_LACSI|nr:unnamed protein product [Lactuca saligna]